MEYQERLLQSWVEMTMNIRGNRLVKELSLNELVICSYLYRHHSQTGNWMTATELCDRTKMLKSQINRILTSLEKREIITRVRSKEDKRKILVAMSEKNIQIYLSEHAQIMEIMNKVECEMGKEKTAQLAELMAEAVRIVGDYQF